MSYKIQIIILSLSIMACSTLPQNHHQKNQNTLRSQEKPAGHKPIGHDNNNKVHTDERSLPKSSVSSSPELSLKSKADYHFTLSEIYSASNNTQKAIAELKKTLIYDPNSTTVLLRLAYQYLKSGDITKAIGSAHSVLEIDPKNQKAAIFLGGLFILPCQSSRKLRDCPLFGY